MNKKIAILGKNDVINAFKYLGIDTYGLTDDASAKNTFLKIKNNLNDFGIIFITENFYQPLKEEITKIVAKTTPAVVVIPDNTGSKNIGINSLSQIVEKATGSNILSK